MLEVWLGERAGPISFSLFMPGTRIALGRLFSLSTMKSSSSLTFGVVCELEVLRAVVAVGEEAEAVDELAAAPLAIVGPVVELVGGLSMRLPEEQCGDSLPPVKDLVHRECAE